MRALSTDSPIYRALSLATDLVLINFMMLLTMLPVVTAGAGLSAGFACCLQILRGDGRQLVRQFTTSFVRCFAPATIGWLGVLGLSGLLGWEWVVTGQLAATGLVIGARAVLVFAILLLAMVTVWLWPLLARDQLAGKPIRIGGLLGLGRTALLASVKFLPRTVAGLAVVIGPLVGGALLPQLGARLLIWYLVIGLAFGSYLLGLLVRRPLGIEMPSDEDETQ